MSGPRTWLDWLGHDASPAAHLVRAGLAVLVLWVVADPQAGSAATRALLAAGLMLWSFDALAQSRHALAAADIRDPHRWSNAARQGAFLAAVLLIVLGATPAAMTGALVGAAVFGAFWLFLPPPGAPSVQDSWDTARPVTGHPLRRWLYHLWPAFSLGLVVVPALSPPDGGWSAPYVMFQAAFLPFLVPLYPAKGPFLGGTSDRIRVAGLFLLGAGLWLGTT